ncbi:MAG: PD-(D/E)XK nuclease family protein [Planctomycetaceae bacterium]|nr:PD-(D/E)XK nuclease family protein [Planctomycetaceae bacterium]
MPITRTFLDWSRPALVALCDYLFDPVAEHGTLDLSDHLMVVPGGRAGRRLQELLVSMADERSIILVPPEIVTLGAVPERLYLQQKPFADDLTQHLAWIRALREFDRDRLQPFFPNLPDDDSFLAWKPFAEILANLHRELAADNLDFGDVISRGSQLDNFPEVARWNILREIQENYLTLLDELNIWDRQTARLFAIKYEECRTDRNIMLVGTVDMNQTTRQMLDQVADDVESIVFAPEKFSPRFDEHGCLKPDAWRYVLSEIKDEQIRIVGKPGDQADEVLRTLGDLNGRYAGEDIVVGVPDESLVPVVEQRLESAGLRSRYGVGRTIKHSLAAKLLLQLADWLDEETVVAFQNLLRHPAVEQYLQREQIDGDWLTELDRYRNKHLPVKLNAHWLGKEEDRQTIEDVHEALSSLLKDWKHQQRLLPEWSPALVQILSKLFDGRELSAAERKDWSLITDAIRSALQKFADLPETLVPAVSGADVLRLLHSEIANTEIPPESHPDAIELLGWLELPWDDAPVLVVTGMNEGFVPSSQNGDLFLPNQLRQILDLEDNQRRAARDAYALSVMAASRAEFTLIAGQMSANNDPLVPSRFLFGDSPELNVSRTLKFFREESTRPSSVPGRLRAGREIAEFSPPRLESYATQLESMRVTEFRDYIQCPYRYFLKHHLRLKSVISSAEELDGGAFGNVLHEVLERFGRHEEIRSQTNPEPIRAFLNHELNHLMEAFYGTDPEPAIRIQTERMRARLSKFAEWQAGWSAEGWRIEHVEEEVRREHEAEFEVDGTPILLRGRIDRIDIHQSSGEVMVFDYKTSDSGKTPEKTHYRKQKGEWIDLQLPLYRHLVKSLGIQADVELAYINLPKKLDDVKHQPANWDADLLASADEKAREIVRAIRENIFWPPSDDGGLMQEFAEICLETTVLEPDDEEGMER